MLLVTIQSDVFFLSLPRKFIIPYLSFHQNLLQTAKIIATQAKSRKIILNNWYADGKFF